MAEVVTKVLHNGEEYCATVQRIQSVDVFLESGRFIMMSISIENCALTGYVLGRTDQTSNEVGNGTRYLYDWTHALFNLTGAKSFQDAEGEPVLAIWRRNGLPGDRIIGLAKIDGSFVFLPDATEVELAG